MKNKILGLALIGCLGLTLTGCKGDLDDFNKQIDKMEEVIDDGELFDEDWAITMDADGMNIFVQKDDDNYYVTSSFGGEKTEMWYVEGEDKYTVYTKYDGEKTYEVITEDEFEMSFEFDIEYLYAEMYEMFKDADEACKEDGMTCTVEKTLFGKVTLTAEEEGFAAEIVIKGGKIQSMKIEEDDGEFSYEFDYGNQKISLPKKSEYTLAK